MKAALVALLLVMPAFAQNPLAGGSVVCGSGDVRFKVKLDYIEHAPAQPEPGKALVYFIHDAGTSAVLAYPTTKIAVDDAWVGADHSNSYFSVSVEPGSIMCAPLCSHHSSTIARSLRTSPRRRGRCIFIVRDW